MLSVEGLDPGVLKEEVSNGGSTFHIDQIVQPVLEHCGPYSHSMEPWVYGDDEIPVSTVTPLFSYQEPDGLALKNS